MALEPEFLPKQTVYLKTDPEKLPRIVTAYKVSAEYISYELACGAQVSYHYSHEMCSDIKSLDQKPEAGFARN